MQLSLDKRDFLSWFSGILWRAQEERESGNEKKPTIRAARTRENEKGAVNLLGPLGA